MLRTNCGMHKMYLWHKLAACAKLTAWWIPTKQSWLWTLIDSCIWPDPYILLCWIFFWKLIFHSSRIQTVFQVNGKLIHKYINHTWIDNKCQFIPDVIEIDDNLNWLSIRRTFSVGSSYFETSTSISTSFKVVVVSWILIGCSFISWELTSQIDVSLNWVLVRDTWGITLLTLDCLCY